MAKSRKVKINLPAIIENVIPVITEEDVTLPMLDVTPVAEEDNIPFTGLLAGDFLPTITTDAEYEELPAPTTEEPEVEEVVVTTLPDEKMLTKLAAAKAVSAFYAGRSLPFKSIYELPKKASVNFNLNRAPSARSAGLIATILTYCEVMPNTLQFVRGSGRIPGNLLGYEGVDADRIFSAGPESGGLSNLLGDRAHYVSGVLQGKGCEEAVFCLDFEGALSNLRAFNTKQEDGEHLFSAAIALLEMLHNHVPEEEVLIDAA